MSDTARLNDDTRNDIRRSNAHLRAARNTALANLMKVSGLCGAMFVTRSSALCRLQCAATGPLVAGFRASQTEATSSTKSQPEIQKSSFTASRVDCCVNRALIWA